MGRSSLWAGVAFERLTAKLLWRWRVRWNGSRRTTMFAATRFALLFPSHPNRLFHAMEKIHLRCSSGHQIPIPSDRVSVATVEEVWCPSCNRQVSASREKNSLSDTGVMRILGDWLPSSSGQPNVETEQLTARKCPRCECGFRESLTVCPHCQCYVGRPLH